MRRKTASSLAAGRCHRLVCKGHVLGHALTQLNRHVRDVGQKTASHTEQCILGPGMEPAEPVITRYILGVLWMKTSLFHTLSTLCMTKQTAHQLNTVQFTNAGN